jgi:mono/diheme cytochrome c family protein
MLEIDEEVVVERRQGRVEELAGYLQRMPDVAWPQVRRGADVYAERCEKCHGPNGRPVTVNALQRGAQTTVPQPRPDFQEAHGDAELVAMARGQGHPAVPGFAPVLSEQDAQALLAYLRLLSNGFVWYSLWCAGCHGDEGRGDGPLATGIDQPHVVFDRAWLSAQSPADLRRKAMHLFDDVEPTAPHFARNVSEGQTRAVLAALRNLQAAEGPATPLPAGAIDPRDGRAAASAADRPRATPGRAAAAAPGALATRPGADTPAPTNAEQFLREQARATAAPVVTAAPAPSPAVPRPALATVSASATSAAARAPRPDRSPPPSASATPAPASTASPVQTRRPAAQATPRKSAAAKAVKPTPARPAVKPKPQIKATARAKPNVKPTPARKPAPRGTAQPTPDHDVEPSRPAPEHVIELPL